MSKIRFVGLDVHAETIAVAVTNHVSQLASIDFFTVPTATFQVLFVFVVLSHGRRRIVHVNVALPDPRAHAFWRRVLAHCIARRRTLLPATMEFLVGTTVGIYVTDRDSASRGRWAESCDISRSRHDGTRSDHRALTGVM
jgi:hypothetical protein